MAALLILTGIRVFGAAPSLEPIADVTLDEDAASAPIIIRATDTDTPADQLTFKVTALVNGGLLVNGLTLEGTGTERTLVIKPAANQSGAARVRVQVIDNTFATVSREFDVTVKPVNDAPVLELLGGSEFTTEAGGTVKFNVRVADVDDPVANLTPTLTAEDPEFISDASITGASFGRSVSITAAHRLGKTRILLRATDPAGAFTEQTVNLTVTLPKDVDFGDAPATYPVLIANNAAWHTVNPGFRLGTAIDAEPDGRPGTSAAGDDLSNLDDEDGVVLGAMLQASQSNSIKVTASAAGKLDAWIDLNQNGVWEHPAERVAAGVPLVGGVNSLSLTLPASAKSGVTFARVRFSATGNLPPDGGAGAGEVEDYRVAVKSAEALFDFGDAPAPYPTTIAQAGARHAASGLLLGALRDVEADGQPHNYARGDDDLDSSDEDGVSMTFPLVPAQSTSLSVRASAAGMLDAWVDFNRDGDWSDPGEQVFMSLPVRAGLNPLSFPVPANASTGLTFARFRLSTTGGLSFTGEATDGEVEDYAAEITSPVAPCLPLPATRPNVIIIVSDDLGYSDLGAHGCTDIPTPHIDSIARNGVRFTSGYVTAPVCSPSRAALLTGRHQQRFGHETNPGTSLERDPHFGLPPTETTIGDRFKELNFATGWVGKSHLGGVTNVYHPMRRGFDEYFGFIESHHHYFDTGEKLEKQEDPIMRGFTPIVETNYLTTAFARECVQYIDRHANEPFLLYAPFNAVHFPQEATTVLRDRAALLPITDPNRRIMAAMLMGLDDAVGAILAKLRQLNIETNTLIFFTTDNGGMTQLGSLNRPLRGGKTEIYEGGIRVPFFMQWKAHLPTNQVFHAPVSTMDILPTAIAAVGGTNAAAWQLDGVNLLPYLCGQSNGVPHPRLFWRVETDGVSPSEEINDGLRAVREGDWKLVKSGVRENWELYNLATDVGETTNLADLRPEIVQQLVSPYDAWSAQMARPRWAVDNLHFVPPDFVLEDIRIGATGISYLAPEFRPDRPQIAFQDEAGNLWRGELDLVSGFLLSGHGQDLQVDTGLAPLDRAVNGPEWGLSTNGPALFFTKPGASGPLQIWRAGSLDAGIDRSQLTTTPTNSFNAYVTQDLTRGSVELLFNVGNVANSSVYFADETSPLNLHGLFAHSGGLGNGHWLAGNAGVAYGVIQGFPIPGVAQIQRYSTSNAVTYFISDDDGDKTDVWGFFAPEFGGEHCYVAVVDRTSIAIYRDLRDRPLGLHTRVATLVQPSDVPPRYIYSLEPLQGARGFNGTSYFSCAAYERNDPLNPGDSQIWIVGLGPDDNGYFFRRVDDGVATGLTADRRAPKTVIGASEILLYYSRKTGTNATQLRVASTGLNPPEHLGTPSGFTSLQFSRSFTAGTNDVNANWMSGTETLNLAPHQGRLFAATGNRMNLQYPTAPNFPTNWTGAQILVKDSAATPWRVDEATPPIFRDHLRVETLVDFTFTTRSNGLPLRDPVNLLIAGLSDINSGSVGAHLATVRTRLDGAVPSWRDSHVATTRAPANVISLGSHVDRFTGVHQIFAGLQNGEIYRGAYDGNDDSKMAWAANAVELTGMGPVTSFAECNGLLYAACGLVQSNRVAEINGGLFVRRDTNRIWQLVYRWPHPAELFNAPEEQRLMRGLTAVPEPHGADRQVLLAGRSWPGVIERIDPDPARGHVVTVELDIRDFVARVWNDDRARQGSVTVAYTGFTAVTNPVTGERVHLVGVWFQHPDDTASPRNGSHFLVRHFNATYELASIEDFSPSVPAGQSLRATRCIAVSPFADDQGGVFYFGGYDTAMDESHDTAWIIRGDWSVWPNLKITQSSSGERQLDWPATGTNWVLEATSTVGPDRTWRRAPGRSTRSVTHETQSVNSRESNLFFRLRKP